jgi:acyl-CoA thioester hydrolase
VSREVKIEVRWRDIDHYGHVNNAVYLNFLEEARDRLIVELFGEEAAWDFVVARIEIDFRAQVTQGDGPVTVRCEVAGIGTSSLRTTEQIRRADGVLAAGSVTVVVPREPDRARSRPLTPEERQVLEAEIDRDGPNA